MASLKPAPARRALRWALAAVVSLAGVACASTARNPFAPASSREAQLLIDIENQGFNDIRLYAVSARGNQSLGAVNGNTRRRAALAWRQLDQLHFRIEVLAGRTYNTHAVSASPGDVVELIIPEDPSRAYLRVR